MYTWTIKEYLKKIESGEIVLNPEIQRSVVYNNDEQAFVIDSILNDIILPAFYLKNDNNKYLIIDGLQRTTSIMKYYKNEIGTKIKDIDTPYSDLEQHLKDKFLNYKLNIIEIDSKTNKKVVQETFYRINTCGKPLTKWEVLWSKINIDGNISIFLKELKDSCPKYERYFGSSNNRGESSWKLLQIISQSNANIDIEDYCENHKNCHFKNIINEFNLDHKLKFVDEIMKGYDYKYQLLNYIFRWLKYYPTLIQNDTDYINTCLIEELREEMIKNDIDTIQKVKNVKNYIKNIFGKILQTTMHEKRKFDNDTKNMLLRDLEKNKSKKVQNGDTLYKCPGCGEWVNENELEVDHKIPHSFFGQTIYKNAQILCRRCNNAKKDN